MKIQLSRRTIVSIVMTLILVLTVMSAAVRRVRVTASQNDNLIVEKLAVENRTSAFQIVSAVKERDLVRLSLKNNYKDPIDGFTLSFGDNSGVQVDFTNSDTNIPPGAVYDYQVSALSVERSGSVIKPLGLTILNVVFEDGTGDGDPNAILDMQNRRRGEKIALSQILPLLDQALDSSEIERPEGLLKLKKQISIVCDGLEKEQPPELQGGILHGKGYVLGDIQQLEEQRPDKDDFRNGLFTIREHYRKKSTKLHG